MMTSRNMEKNSKIMKILYRTRFSHLLLIIDFIDNFWRPHLDILHLSTEHNNRGHHENNPVNKQNSLLVLGVWLEKLWFWNTIAHFWSTLPCLHPFSIFLFKYFLSKIFEIILLATRSEKLHPFEVLGRDKYPSFVFPVGCQRYFWVVWIVCVFPMCICLPFGHQCMS